MSESIEAAEGFAARLLASNDSFDQHSCGRAGLRRPCTLSLINPKRMPEH
jgi:hypothetical protein